jgi:hypothetical protein
MELFVPVVAKKELHHNFLSTLDPTAAGVRAVLTQWAEGFDDRDGKFVREFQTTYNSSFWELYLFAVLKYLAIQVDFSFKAPDFVSAYHPIAIEAAIASYAHDDAPEWQKTLAVLANKDLATRRRASIIRLSNALLGKSKAFKDRYAALPHMAGRSYLVAISNYGTQDFYLQGDAPMKRLLFDIEKEKVIYKANGAPVPLGLFKSDGYAHISAVLYSSLATFGKARALGKDEGDITFRAVRKKENAKPIYIDSRKSDYKESLTDGMVLFTNPYAPVPVNAELFDDAGIRRYVANKKGGFDVSFHPEGDLYFRMVQHNINRGKPASWLTRLAMSLHSVIRKVIHAVASFAVRPTAAK